MSKKLLYIIGAIIIFVGVGIGVVFALQTVTPKEVDQVTNTTNNTNATTTDEKQDESLDNLSVANDENIKFSIDDLYSHMMSYSANNRGAIPTSAALLSDFQSQYLKDLDLSNKVTGKAYNIVFNGTASKEVIAYQPGYVCSEDTTKIPLPGEARQYAFSTVLPSGTFHCVSP